VSSEAKKNPVWHFLHVEGLLHLSQFEPQAAQLKSKLTKNPAEHLIQKLFPLLFKQVWQLAEQGKHKPVVEFKPNPVEQAVQTPDGVQDEQPLGQVAQFPPTPKVNPDPQAVQANVTLLQTVQPPVGQEVQLPNELT